MILNLVLTSLKLFYLYEISARLFMLKPPDKHHLLQIGFFIRRIELIRQLHVSNCELRYNFEMVMLGTLHEPI